MVGLGRSTLPLIGEADFGLASSAAVLSFIVAFGLAKALTNLGAGAFAQRLGRRRLLVLGWALALPVPLLIAVAPSWGWVIAGNALLGVNQGLAWSMTVVMKIDLVGPKRRGLALGLNESAGYGGVAIAAMLSRWLASDYAARDVLAAGGAVVAVVALFVSLLLVRDTAEHVALEQSSARWDGTDAARRFGRRSPMRPTATPRSGRPHKPGSQTISMTRSRGASFRSTWPRAGRRPPRSASWQGSIRLSGP